MSAGWRQITLAKGSQRFIFRYGRGQESNVLESFRSLAARPDSGFDWFDAAVLCFKLARRLEKQLDHQAASPRPAKAAG